MHYPECNWCAHTALSVYWARIWLPIRGHLSTCLRYGSVLSSKLVAEEVIALLLLASALSDVCGVTETTFSAKEEVLPTNAQPTQSTRYTSCYNNQLHTFGMRCLHVVRLRSETTLLHTSSQIFLNSNLSAFAKFASNKWNSWEEVVNENSLSSTSW
jgi:hypothetical protein